MPQTKPPLARLILLAILLAGCVVAFSFLTRTRPTAITTQPASTRAMSQPSTRIAEALPPLKTFIDMVLRDHADFPTTRPLDQLLDLSDAAHFLIPDPVLIDGHGSLWVTRPDGATLEDALGSATVFRPTYFVNRPVAFVHWWRENKIFVVAKSLGHNAQSQSYELISETSARPIGTGADYDWSRGFSLPDGRLGAPTSDGISIFTIPNRGAIAESRSPSLLEVEQTKETAALSRPSTQPSQLTQSTTHAPVEICFFQNSVIAWIPPSISSVESKPVIHAGSKGAIRWTDGVWSRLDDDLWPAGLIQLLPLADTILQVVHPTDASAAADAPDAINTGKIAVVPMEKAQVPDEDLIRLISQLSDPDPKLRDDASLQLSRYRATLWPIIDRVMDIVPPEAQARLKILKQAQIRPLVGECEPVDGQLTLIRRYANGGALFYNPKGALLPRGDDAIEAVTPAWLLAQPGSAIRLLQGEFLTDLDPLKQWFGPTGYGSWIASDDIQGPRFYTGGGVWTTLLRDNEKGFNAFLRTDRQGRYLFRKQEVAGVNFNDGPTLIIDPHLPDPRPRLPIWASTQQGMVGWDDQDYPAINDGKNTQTFGTGSWNLLDDTKPFHSTSEEVAKIPGDWPADLGKPLLAASDGTVYFDGRQSLVSITKEGVRQVLALPQQAMGTAEPWLVEMSKDRFLLFNEPGRIVRIHRTDNDLTLEATFARGVPNADKLTRMWIDPLGRLAIISGDHDLAIGFPAGYIPRDTRYLIPIKVLDEIGKD